MVIHRELLFATSFADAYASAKSLEMKAAFNNKLPHQTGDVKVNPINPINPDSNTPLQRAEFPPKTGFMLVNWDVSHK